MQVPVRFVLCLNIMVVFDWICTNRLIEEIFHPNKNILKDSN